MLVKGDAKMWATSAKNNGWKVVKTPEVNSVLVKPGKSSKDAGHVAWVEKVVKTKSGYQVSILETNFGDTIKQKHSWHRRTINHVSGYQYILAPKKR